jgi:hypothetical protein
MIGSSRVCPIWGLRWRSPHRRCWPSRPDLGKRWPSRLVATAAEDRLISARHSARSHGFAIAASQMVFPHELAQTTAPSATSAAVVPNLLAARPHRASDCRRSHRAASWRLHEVSTWQAAVAVRKLSFEHEGDRREARLRSCGRRGWHADRSAASHLSLSLTRRSIQAVFFRRRHQPRRPPLAKIRPGRPAPTMGPGRILVELAAAGE